MDIPTTNNNLHKDVFEHFHLIVPFWIFLGKNLASGKSAWFYSSTAVNGVEAELKKPNAQASVDGK